MQALTGRQVFTDQWDPRIDNNMGHIALTRGADAIAVVPASAHFIAKLAHGLCDDLLSTMAVARPRPGCALLVAPAMNVEMWEHPATQRNVHTIKSDGVEVLGPASGDQACGETGAGRMLEPHEILEDLIAHFQPKLLRDKRVLITAGPTFETIDAVRGITNRSSGKMGYAVARAALEAGARVTLVSGPTSLAAPAGAQRVDVVSAREMFEAVKKRVADADIFVSVAAVSDYHVASPRRQKIKSSARRLRLELVPNPDILAWVASRPRPPFCVGFAAETDNLRRHAEAKRRAKKVPLLAANLAQHAIGADDNELTLFDDAGAHKLPRAPKDVVARQLVAHIAKLYKAASCKR
jgi:phosphopantothenoylcysteine decarboxylase/phosphopantothenate--cysteine ligase